MSFKADPKTVLKLARDVQMAKHLMAKECPFDNVLQSDWEEAYEAACEGLALPVGVDPTEEDILYELDRIEDKRRNGVGS